MPASSPLPRSVRVRPALAWLSLALALAIAALGCGGSSPAARTGRVHRGKPRANATSLAPSPSERDDDPEEGASSSDGIVHWERRLRQDEPGLLADFQRRADRYGCTTSSDADSVLARCGEAPIKLIKRGRDVSVACQGITLDACQGLFRRIVEEGASSDGPNPHMW